MDNPWYNIRPRAVVYLFLLLLLYFHSPETQEGSPQQWDPWRKNKWREGKWRKNKRGKDKWREDERRENEWRETRRFSSATQKTNRFWVGWYWSSNSWYNYGSEGYWQSPGQNQVRLQTVTDRSINISTWYLSAQNCWNTGKKNFLGFNLLWLVKASHSNGNKREKTETWKWSYW